MIALRCLQVTNLLASRAWHARAAAVQCHGIGLLLLVEAGPGPDRALSSNRDGHVVPRVNDFKVRFISLQCLKL